jgi:hypothetical protein
MRWWLLALSDSASQRKGRGGLGQPIIFEATIVLRAGRTSGMSSCVRPISPRRCPTEATYEYRYRLGSEKKYAGGTQVETDVDKYGTGATSSGLGLQGTLDELDGCDEIGVEGSMRTGIACLSALVPLDTASPQNMVSGSHQLRLFVKAFGSTRC